MLFACDVLHEKNLVALCPQFNVIIDVILHQCTIASEECPVNAVREELMQHRSKHNSGKVFRVSYLFTIADAAITLFSAGYGQGGEAQNFYRQQQYTQGR